MNRRKPQRDRSRILTPEGLQKLQARIREKEIQHGEKFTRQKISDLAGLHPDTVSKIFLCKQGVDRDSIQRLFCAFELELAESDLISTIQACLPKPDSNFVGREGAIADLNTFVKEGAKVILIHAKGGVGKTTLARKYLHQHFGSYIEFPIAKEPQNITSVESLIEERLKQLGEEPGREFGVSLDRLKRKLETERIGVLIDNLEPALDGNGKFIEPHRRYVELLRVLAEPEVKSITLITSRECLRESALTVHHYRLEGLDVPAWQEFFNSRNLQTNSPALDAMHRAYGGNAKAMEILISAIIQDYEGNLEAYWQANQGDLLIERELEDLVVCQFNRLQQLNPDAYKLLCRMGCYRYQDVATVPEEGLFCMLWDVPEAQHRRVVKSLRDRSLVEFRNGEYWLHPVIRAEALARLRVSQDWEKGNQRAAEFWTESVKTVETVEDARRAFEAYHHYVDIDYFEQAARVILEVKSHNDPSEHLGYACWRLGLLHQVISAVIQIKDEINDAYSLSSFNRILGYAYNLLGDIHKAINYHKESVRVASKYLDSLYSKSTIDRRYGQIGDMQLAYWVNIGVAKLDLWELTEAIEAFEEVLSLAESREHYRYSIEAYFCLALLKSYLGFNKEAYDFAEKAEAQMRLSELDVSHWSRWSRGYYFLFLGKTRNNLGEIEKSFEMYQRAIVYSEENYYSQVKAKALDGLAELYRKQEDFETALSHHSEAIELLDKIGAKCDLAEAYYQLGLTYQKMGNAQQSQENFDKAILLFREMEAPKQVEKVQRSIGN